MGGSRAARRAGWAPRGAGLHPFSSTRAPPAACGPSARSRRRPPRCPPRPTPRARRGAAPRGPRSPRAPAGPAPL
eukprot:1856737-Pyramimonas_sp.AAC.1